MRVQNRIGVEPPPALVRAGQRLETRGHRCLGASVGSALASVTARRVRGVDHRQRLGDGCRCVSARLDGVLADLSRRAAVPGLWGTRASWNLHLAEVARVARDAPEFHEDRRRKASSRSVHFRRRRRRCSSAPLPDLRWARSDGAQSNAVGN